MESTPVYSRSGYILSDIDTSRIAELTQNTDIVGASCSMVDGKLEINAANADGVTLFYLAIQNQEWNVAEYLLDLGANPKLVPPKDRPKVWQFELLDFDGDQSFSDRLELRIGWLRILQDMDVLEAANKEFMKRLMFVDRYDLKEVNGSILELLSKRNISRLKDPFYICCNNDWIDIYASVIKKTIDRIKVNYQQFCYAFERGSLDFFRMICIESICRKFIDLLLHEIRRDSYSMKSLIEIISQSRYEEKSNFLLNLIITNNLYSLCRALFQAAAEKGFSDLVERTLMMYPAEVFADGINDNLINLMFYAYNVYTCENIKQADRYTGYVDCLKLIITKMAPRNDETIDLCQIFKQSDIRAVAIAIRENRFDIVERMFRNYESRQFSIDVYFSSRYSTTSHCFGINMMCCAISCADYGMVEFLTRTGMDINTPSRCNLIHIVSSFPQLFLGLTCLLNLNDKALETVDESEVLENIKIVVKDFAGNFTGTARSPRDSHMRCNRCTARSTRYSHMESNCCRRRRSRPNYPERRSLIACHETETSQTITVLDIIISSFNKYSKQFILELLTFFLDFFDFNLYVPLSVSDKLSITDFLVRNQEVEDRLFYLFQAGASPEFIRHYAKHFRNRITRCDISNTSKEYYSIHHCEALVFERNKDFFGN